MSKPDLELKAYEDGDICQHMQQDVHDCDVKCANCGHVCSDHENEHLHITRACVADDKCLCVEFVTPHNTEGFQRGKMEFKHP